MMIIGVDYHPSFQQMAFLIEETGEYGERELKHSDGEAERFYRDLHQRGIRVQVGMEATGYSRWFERLLAQLGFELWISDPAEIEAKRVKKRKTDREDARLLLRLMREERFPRIWVPSPENRDLRQLLWHRHRLVQMRTRIMNQLQALAMNEDSASLTRIDAGFLPRQMALFFSGQFLLSGLWQSDPPKNKAGFSAESERKQRPFLGIFDRRGKLVQEVHLPGDVRFDPPAKPDSKNAENAAGTAVDLSRAVTGEDGSVYFLRPGPKPTIYVISSVGEVLRHFAINPPSERATNPSVFLAAGRLAFDFYELGSKSSPRTRLLVLVVDAQTGAELWIYEPSKDLYGIPICYSGRDFTFLSMTPDRHLALLRASSQ